MAEWGISKLTVRPTLAVVLRYGLAVLLVAIALAIAVITHFHHSPPRFVSHFVLLAIAITFWCTGTGPGLLALLLSCLGVAVLARTHFLTPDFPLVQFSIFFVVFSLLMSLFSTSRRRALQELRKARDELEIKVAERTAELTRSERELRDVVDTIPASVWSTLPDGSNTYVNKRFVEYSGSSAEQMAGSGWKTLIHPDDLERHECKWMEAVVAGKPHENEVRSRRSDGQYRWQLDRGVPLRDADGNIVKWYGVTTDIEDRKRAEEALRTSEAYLAEAQRLSQTGSWAWNPATDNAYYSEECYRLLGFDPHEPPPRLETVIQRIHPDDQTRCRHRFEKAIRDKVDFDLDYRIVHPDKRVRDIHCVGHAVLDRSGDLVELVGTVIDITERKRADEEREKMHQLEADLAHVNRVNMMGELAASLAHEIKQPITAAITSANACLGWLAHDPPELERARAAAIRIEKDGNRAAEVINRLRSFYKKGTPPEPEMIQVNEIVREIMALLQSEAGKHSISMNCELAPDMPRIAADRVQLQQVFMNLMLNAIEAMKGTGGELTITSRLNNEGELTISVSDTGVGLPAESAERIFEAFYTTKPQGTGMGLAITRSIVESHGGRLWASANHGPGATFHFTLRSEGEGLA